MVDTVVGILTIAGATLVALAGIGVVRFPDLYSRMHAATKATTLGFGLIAIAGAIAVEGGRDKIILAVVFLFVTAPAAAHFVGRAAYRVEGIEIRLDGDDDLGKLVDDEDGAA